MSKPRTVIKIGGSLIKRDRAPDNLISHLEALKQEGFNLILICGGGSFADEVRNLYDIYNLSNNAAHWMAIKAMDMNSLLISDISKQFKVAQSPEECTKYLEQEKIPILTPFPYLRKEDPLPRSWKVTSDSISLYFAEKLNSQKHVMLKDIQGIYRNSEKRENIMEEISAEELRNMETCVDDYFPYLIEDYGRESYVVSGFHPERLGNVIKGEKTICTKIIP